MRNYLNDEPCLLPIAAADALAWLRGNLADKDVLLRARLSPEAVFVVNLPSRRAYRRAVTLMLNYWRHGAVFLVTRSGNPVVENFISKHNGLVTIQETVTLPGEVTFSAKRYIVQPDDFHAWMQKVSGNAAIGRRWLEKNLPERLKEKCSKTHRQPDRSQFLYNAQTASAPCAQPVFARIQSDPFPTLC